MALYIVETTSNVVLSTIYNTLVQLYLDYKGKQGLTRVTKGYRGLQGVTSGSRALQEVTRGYRGLQEVT